MMIIASALTQCMMRNAKGCSLRGRSVALATMSVMLDSNLRNLSPHYGGNRVSQATHDVVCKIAGLSAKLRSSIDRGLIGMAVLIALSIALVAAQKIIPAAAPQGESVQPSERN